VNVDDGELSWQSALDKMLDLMKTQLDTINRVLDSYYDEYGEEDEPDPGEEEDDDESTATETYAVGGDSEDKRAAGQTPLRVAAEKTP